jgi:hypothetical protein
VGIYKVDDKEAGLPYVKRPLCSGKVFRVHPGGKRVEAAHGFYEMPHRLKCPAAEMPYQKAKAPHPEGHKVKVDIHLAREKGDPAVQRVIRF